VTRLSAFLAASLALAAPYSAGMPALDSGRRELRLGPRVVVDDRRQRSTWRQPEVDRDAVSETAQRDAVERAKAKRERRVARGW